jgi:hypothetical protein
MNKANDCIIEYVKTMELQHGLSVKMKRNPKSRSRNEKFELEYEKLQ